MSVSLAKGGNVSLTKAAPNLTSVTVALGWQVRASTGADYDLDASALALGQDHKIISDAWFVFFNNLRSPDGSIEHLGDNLVGGEGGDDEQINIELTAVPPNINSIVFAVSIYEADSRRQSFGQVRNAFIRVVDRNTGSELTRFDLTEEASTETAMVFGELYRYNGEWKFRAIGQGYASGLRGIALDFGVNVG
jgi:tellurium resistance protein TerD